MTLHLAVALDGTGWHPGSPRTDEVFTGGYWVDLVAEAERGLLDFVTFEDGYAPPGHLDAILTAIRVGPVTGRIGLVPTAVVTHTEPFHVSTEIATLDYVSTGRAGLRVRVSHREDEAALFGRRDVTAETQDTLFEEAADYVEVVRRLWDSWEDDAEIRDASTGRFVDREKLHYIDFEGSRFSVRGPSITPRPPQGQPIVTALAHNPRAYRLAARSTDVAFVTPDGFGRNGPGTTTPIGDAATVLADLGEAVAAQGREERPLVLGDAVVLLDDTAADAGERKQRLDEAHGSPWRSDATVVTGTAADVADLIESWHATGLDGARLRPAENAHDLPRITRELVPELQRRGLFRTAYEADTLRGHLGLTRPADRYART